MADEFIRLFPHERATSTTAEDSAQIEISDDQADSLSTSYAIADGMGIVLELFWLLLRALFSA